MKDKPDCYTCIHRRTIPGDAHSECVHPKINGGDRIIAPMMLMAQKHCAITKRLNVSGDEYGIRQGWFFWPINFDPTWLLTCDGFQSKEVHKNT